MDHKNCARVARPSFCVLVMLMQYIQRCGGSGLVHKTSWVHAVLLNDYVNFKNVIICFNSYHSQHQNYWTHLAYTAHC